ncbi:MAG: glutathione-disulfide reductase [Rhodobacterales bacterium]|nr:MAG: glutathione-disulfide reductase [Rhodobacterales bacterium]
MSFDYDLFVIGGGSGGVRAARQAAAAGARVALAEEYRMGGTCVIRGCVPKKLMVYASGYRSMPEDARAFGWDIPDGGFDWQAFRPKLRAELDRLEGVYNRLLDNSGVTVFAQRATVADPHEVELTDGTRISAKHILVAVGGAPVMPDLPNADLGITSNDIFLMEKLPKSILIVGGGYIACEFACILNGLGVEVTQYYRGAQILRGFDEECRGHIADEMIAGGVNLHLGTNIAEMECAADHEKGSDRSEGGEAGPLHAPSDPDGPVWVRSTNGEARVFDKVMFATGRAPVTAGLGLEELGVKLSRNGAIEVDDYSQTSVPSIYAIGDVTDRVQLTPVAIREAMAFVDTVFRGNPTKVDHDLIPSAIFTQPEMGTIGLSEEEARDAGPIKVFVSSFKPMQESFAGQATRVLMKLIVCADTDRVLGCHIVAPHAGEMIQLAGIAVKMGATKAQFDQVCAVHPTMAEELVTMREPTRTA